MASDGLVNPRELREGTLWYDPDASVSLPDRLMRAVQYYREKKGAFPKVCHVAPDHAEILGQETAGVWINADPRIKPNHFWIGTVPKIAAPPSAKNLVVAEAPAAKELPHGKASAPRLTEVRPVSKPRESAPARRVKRGSR